MEVSWLAFGHLALGQNWTYVTNQFLSWWLVDCTWYRISC